MKGYFTNPELKLSSMVFLSLMTLFFLLTFFILKLHHDSLKHDYIKSFGAITARIIEENPELEKEIVPLITKEISEEEAEKGVAVLKQYGLTENLNDHLFPYVNATIKKDHYTIIFLYFLMTFLLFLLNYVQYGFFYEKIRKLTLGAKKVVEGDFDITINETKEGDFSKLAVAFNGMRETIRNHLSELREEKKFLVDLLSDISHQLKTPLSSMMVFNEIMLNKELSKEQRQIFLLQNQKQLERMNWLIQSILKLARLDAKAIQLDKKLQSLNETVQESIDALEGKAVEGKVYIHVKENEEVEFIHDRLWLKEAFINIIKNCIEHTPEEGEINIDVTENPIYKRVVIEDTGEGISKDDLPNIFKRFYKAKTSRKTDSVGIGLALAKSIIESHNGMIEAKSQLGKGTKFIITFLKY
jgi:signal transduction histidine kinase